MAGSLYRQNIEKAALQIPIQIRKLFVLKICMLTNFIISCTTVKFNYNKHECPFHHRYFKFARFTSKNPLFINIQTLKAIIQSEMSCINLIEHKIHFLLKCALNVHFIGIQHHIYFFKNSSCSSCVKGF